MWSAAALLYVRFNPFQQTTMLHQMTETSTQKSMEYLYKWKYYHFKKNIVARE